ncbi:MAG: GTPase HflX, partial [Acidobacteriales bacterium]
MQERAILVGLDLKRRRAAGAEPQADQPRPTPEDSLAELQALARSAGASVVDQVIQSRTSPEAATLVGAGKVRELQHLVNGLEADVVLFDQELTPTQQRNLEKEL